MEQEAREARQSERRPGKTGDFFLASTRKRREQSKRSEQRDRARERKRKRAGARASTKAQESESNGQEATREERKSKGNRMKYMFKPPFNVKVGLS
jgi:hypothetical protein